MALARKGDDRSRLELLSVLAEEMMTAVLVVDPVNQICTGLNRRAREALEIAADEDLEAKPFLLSELEPAAARQGRLAFSPRFLQTEGLRQDVMMKKRDGRVIVANIAVKHVQLSDGATVHLLMFDDVTVERKLQRDIETKQEEIRSAYGKVLEQNKQLMALDGAKDKFIALTSHELRTPLAAIVSTAEVLHLKLYESEEQRDQFIGTVYEQSLHLMELVNDILDFAKVRAGKVELYVEEVNLVPVVEKLAGAFYQMASQSQVTIDVEAPEKDVVAFADVLRVKEVVNNVVNNAIKYNRPGGNVTIRFEILAAQKMARVVVTDTGPGIPEDGVDHVFNEFETVGHVARHHKGTGLGMPISRRLMHALGGNLTFASVVGQGTSFFIDFPTEKVLAEDLYRKRLSSWDDQAA